MLGRITAQFEPKMIADVRNEHIEGAKREPDWEIRHTESVEVIRNFLMKAGLRNGQYTIFSDEPVEMGGEGAAPPMFHYFLAGALLCECAQYVWNAAQLGLLDTINKLEMTIQGSFKVAPFVGLTENETPALRDLFVKTKIHSSASPKDIERLARVAAHRCPAHQSLRLPVQIKNVVELNGSKIAEFDDA